MFGLSLSVYGDMDGEQYESFVCLADEYRTWAENNFNSYRGFQRFLGGIYPFFNKRVWASLQGLNLDKIIK